MAKKKPSTADILKAAREEAAKAAGGAPADKAAESASPETEAAQPATDAPKKPTAAPKSTADILAAARAQATGGAASEKKAAPAAKAKPAASGKKPTSTAEILAAARAQSAGGAAAETPAKAPAKPAAASAAPKGPAGEKPSVQEMLKAVREGKKPGPAEPTKTADKPPAAPKVATIPKKPALPTAKKTAKAEPSRRGLLAALLITPFAFAWISLSLTATAGLLGIARFLFPNVLVEPPMKFKVGPLSDYPLGSVSTKWKAARGIWIVHTDRYKGRNLIYALASVCTHLGCTPSWLEGEQKYKCPCHGSGFYIDGINFEGPAPRPLERVGIKIAADGALEVDKSVKFQEELGQWEDPASFVEVV